MKDGFAAFMEQLRSDSLYQRQVPSCYYMKELGIFLVHDFNEWDPVEEQLPKVRQKYQSRIEHFMRDITEPTLFMYYLCAEDDVLYINSNYQDILTCIKSFNPSNSIVFIADERYRINIPCYYVKNDKNSDIADRFSSQNEKLLEFINAIPYSKLRKKQNIEFYNTKQNKKVISKIKKRIIRALNLSFKGTYHHYLTFFD